MSRALAATAAAVVLPLLLLPGCLEATQAAWAVEATQLDVLLGDGARANGVRIALLDTGIDLDHPALQHLKDQERGNGELIAYKDFLDGPDRPTDKEGHGTFVAGVLVGAAPSGLTATVHPRSGLRGIAPGADLLVARLCDHDQCQPFALAPAIRWAVQHGADVISLSIGFRPLLLAPVVVDDVRSALREARDEGAVVVAAAGNTGDAVGNVLFPASEQGVLAVGATDRDLQVRDSSAKGLGGKPDLVAPGEGIVGPWGDSGLVTIDGTSAAVPFATAAVALTLAEGFGERDAQDVDRLLTALRDTARPLDGQRQPVDPRAGNGLLQAATARHAYLVPTRSLD